MPEEQIGYLGYISGRGKSKESLAVTIHRKIRDRTDFKPHAPIAIVATIHTRKQITLKIRLVEADGDKIK